MGLNTMCATPIVDEVLFSQDIPKEVNMLLQQAVSEYHNGDKAEQTLWRALNHSPERLEVYVALYKLYFYKNRLEDAERMTLMALERAASLGGFSTDWRDLNHDSSQWVKAYGAARMYLYTLKALAFIKLRRGQYDLAKCVLFKLSELDKDDQVGWSVIFDLLNAMMEE